MEGKQNVQGEWKHPISAGGQKSKWAGRWFLPLELLGLVGPAIGAALGMLLLVICLWALALANAIFQSLFISMMIAAVERNLALFLVFSLVMGYCEYFARKSYAGYALFFPMRNAASFAFSMWVLAWVLRTVGYLANVALLSQSGTLLRENLLALFALALLLGFFTVAARRAAIGRRS